MALRGGQIKTTISSYLEKSVPILICNKLVQKLIKYMSTFYWLAEGHLKKEAR